MLAPVIVNGKEPIIGQIDFLRYGYTVIREQVVPYESWMPLESPDVDKIRRRPYKGLTEFEVSLRATWVSMLRHYAADGARGVLFCESDAVPGVSACKLSELASSADFDIIRPFMKCEWAVAPSHVVDGDIHVLPWSQVRARHYRDERFFWGTHALYVRDSAGMSKLADAMEKYRLPVDVALCKGQMTGRLAWELQMLIYLFKVRSGRVGTIRYDTD